MSNCSTCGMCELEIDFEKETAKRLCTINNKFVHMDSMCNKHVLKGKVINRELICDAEIEIDHIESLG